MDGDDKPFACSFKGCSQKFVTEDKLAIHLQKHELNIDGLASPLFPDQTPTPSTFLRDCENFGLFQDLGVKNPFDESFRKAVIDPEGNVLVDADGGEMPSFPPDSAAILSMLNTPTGFKDLPSFMKRYPSLLTPSVEKSLFNTIDNLDTPLAENPLVGSSSPMLAQTLRRSLSVMRGRKPASTITTSTPGIATSSAVETTTTPSSTNSSAPSSPSTSTATVSSPLALPQGECIMSTSIHSQAPGTSLSAPSVGAVPIVSVADVKQPTDAPAAAIPASKSIPSVSVSARPMVIPATSAIPQTVQTLAFIVPGKSANLNIAELKALPVITQLKPSRSAASTAVVQPLITATAAAAPVSQPGEPPDTGTLVKQKLKQALIKDGPSLPTTTSPQTGGALLTTSANGHIALMMSNQKHPLSPSDDDQNDVEDKRMRTLERNRDAARRCRKKKKMFIQTLEEKLKESNQLNSQLLSENARLKMEITELKALFLAHKSCQVTKKQMEDGLLDSLLFAERSLTAEAQAT